MKNTFDLYRCHQLEWKNLKYVDALKFRVDKASEAMNYYRGLAKSEDINEYIKYKKMYINSEDAMNFNRKLLEELGEPQ